MSEGDGRMKDKVKLAAHLLLASETNPTLRHALGRSWQRPDKLDVREAKRMLWLGNRREVERDLADEWIADQFVRFLAATTHELEYEMKRLQKMWKRYDGK